MRRKLLLPGALVPLLLASAYVADLAGRWRGSLDSPVGALPVQYTFTPSGTTLTGTLEMEIGSFPLTEGVIRGDSVFFNADIEVVKLAHRGELRGDTLYLAVHDGSTEMPTAKLTRAPAQ